MEGVLVQPETVRADVTGIEVSGSDLAHAAGAHASTEASEMLTAAEAADVPTAAKSSHMAATKAATETSAVTAATATAAAAGLRCAGKQARSKKRSGQYRNCSFHRDSPFRSFRRRFA
jgi:hypothetical protein